MTRKTTAYANKLRQGAAPKRSDAITLSRLHNSRLSAAEIGRVLTPCRAALDAMRTGVATHAQWVYLCTAGHVAEAIEDGGIYWGQREIIDEANTALATVGDRAGIATGTWTPPTLRGQEITALQDLVAAHSRQIRELTYREYTQAANKSVARVATSGGQVFVQKATP